MAAILFLFGSVKQICFQQTFSSWRSMGTLNVTTLFGWQAATMAAKMNTDLQKKMKNTAFKDTFSKFCKTHILIIYVFISFLYIEQH